MNTYRDSLSRAVLTSRATKRDSPSRQKLLLWQDVRARAIDQQMDADRRAVGERVAEIFRWLFLAVFAVLVNLPRVGAGAIGADLLLLAWAAANVVLTVLIARRHRPGRAFSLTTLGIDVAFGAALLHLASGYASPYFLAYFLVVTGLSMRLGTAASLATALVVSIVYLAEGGDALLGTSAGRVFLFVAVALATGLMSRELERERRLAISRAAQADVLREMNVGMGGSLDIKDVFEVVLQYALKMTSAERGGLNLAFDDHVEPAAGEAYEEEEVLKVARSGEAAFLENRGALLVPIASGEGVTAVLALRTRARSFSNQDLFMINALAGSTAVPLANALHYQRSAKEAISDGLTGLLNHREYRRRLDAEFARAVHRGGRLSIILVDLDHFKQVNDALGHQHGDQVIRAAADLLRSTARSQDAVARYGGDELAVILVDAGAEGAELVATRLVEAVHAASITTTPGRVLTLSIGVATYPDDAVTAGELVMAADQALYLAKREGRGRYATSRGMVSRIERDKDELVGMLTEVGPQAMVAIAHAVDNLRPGMRGHSSRVAALSERIARACGYPATAMGDLRAAAFLHDVGTVLATAEDAGQPEMGERLVERGPFPAQVPKAVRHQRERWDGEGCPDRLAGADIPLEARIVGLAEAFEERVSGRKDQALRPLEALDQLAADAGAYDPGLLAALRSLLDEGDLALGLLPPASPPLAAATV